MRKFQLLGAFALTLLFGCNSYARDFVQLVRAWMAKVPRPDSAWADDPDPPRYSDL